MHPFYLVVLFKQSQKVPGFKAFDSYNMLTEKGHSLKPIIKAMKLWGAQWG
jgi:Predicted transcriptional regulators